MNESTILLTGVTGILGRHVLYELLQLFVQGKKTGRLVVIIRSTPGQNGSDRLKAVLIHRYRPAYLSGLGYDHLMQFITVIDSRIEELNDDHFRSLRGLDNLYVIHCAAATDLSDTDAARQSAHSNNYLATRHLISWCTPLLRKFIFVSSAFSLGHYQGLIADQYIRYGSDGKPLPSEATNYRNPYEQIKMRTEYELIEYCRQYGKNWQIIRPSSICGRMLDAPLYYTPTFNVFYLVGKFLQTCSASGILRKGDKLRIVSNPQGSVNIVPVDYVAKAIAGTFENDAVEQLNVVSTDQIPVPYLLQCMCSFEGIKCEVIDSAPVSADMSVAERQYYETIGPTLSAYFATPNHQFDTTRLRSLIPGIAEAEVKRHFKDLYGFAYEHQFASL